MCVSFGKDVSGEGGNVDVLINYFIIFFYLFFFNVLFCMSTCLCAPNVLHEKTTQFVDRSRCHGKGIYWMILVVIDTPAVLSHHGLSLSNCHLNAMQKTKKIVKLLLAFPLSLC